MSKVRDLGISGYVYRILFNAQDNTTGSVICNSVTSKPFAIDTGVRQGGIVSTFLNKLFIDGLLTRLETSSEGAKVISVYSGNSSFADDITLIATPPLALQSMLNY